MPSGCCRRGGWTQRPPATTTVSYPALQPPPWSPMPLRRWTVPTSACASPGSKASRSSDLVAVIIRNSETFASALDGVSRYLHNMTPDRVELVRGPRAAVFTLTTTVRRSPPRPVGREGPRLGDGRIPPDARRGLRPAEGDHAAPAHRAARELPRHVPVSRGVRVGPELRASAQPHTHAADPRAGRGGAGTGRKVPHRHRPRTRGDRPRPRPGPAPPGRQSRQSGSRSPGPCRCTRGSSSADSPTPAPPSRRSWTTCASTGVGAVRDRSADLPDRDHAGVLRTEQLHPGMPALVRRVAAAVADASESREPEDPA